MFDQIFQQQMINDQIMHQQLQDQLFQQQMINDQIMHQQLQDQLFQQQMINDQRQRLDEEYRRIEAEIAATRAAIFNSDPEFFGIK